MVSAFKSSWTIVSAAVLFQLHAAYGLGFGGTPSNPVLLGNTSTLPSGWSGTPFCIADCVFNDTPIINELLLGPSFVDAVGLTIESCVGFCDAQGYRMAGLKGTECRCANIYNPDSCFESDPGECTQAGFADGCPGNEFESCGLADGTPPLFNIFFKRALSPFGCSDFVWPGGAALTAVGSWRFSYFYNDSVSARALPHNAVNLGLPRGNLTTEACTTACGNAGFVLAGVEFADECYCGNALQNGAHPITDCSLVTEQPFGDLMPCKGNSLEFCGGPNVISIYTLPGTGLVPLLPFDTVFNNFCSGRDCFGHT